MILDGKRILVTGGTGSLGKVLIRRVLSGEFGTPEKVIVFSRDEAKQHDMRVHYLKARAATEEVIYRDYQRVLDFRLGDLRDYHDVRLAVRDADVIINGGALKQVPTCEYFPLQAVKTNCLGVANIIQAVQEFDCHVETVIGISTDKACKPVSVMGMSKAIQERMMVAANLHSPTRFVSVRYGNVLASRGSVIPLFHEQIARGGPVTITSRQMTRFLLSLDQAVDTVLAALRSARPGDTYIPIVPSVTIENVAAALVGDRDIEIRDIGIRPGEKIHEELVSQEESLRVFRRDGDFYVISPLLPELRDSADGPQEPILRDAYTSADDLLDFEQTCDLLRRNSLMVEDSHLGQESELLR